MGIEKPWANQVRFKSIITVPHSSILPTAKKKLYRSKQKRFYDKLKSPALRPEVVHYVRMLKFHQRPSKIATLHDILHVY